MLTIPFNFLENRNIDLVLPNGSHINLEYREGEKGINSIFVGVDSEKLLVRNFSSRSIILSVVPLRRIKV